MTSPLPPKRRDTRGWEDLIRQDRVRLGQLDRGLNGRYPPLRPVPANVLPDDAEEDDPDDLIQFENRDSASCSGSNASIKIGLAHVPEDGSEQVFYNGTPLKRTDWSRTDTVLTIPGEPWFRSGKVAWVDYAYYDDGEPDALSSFTLRGAVSGNANLPRPLPTGTATGDTILLLVMNQRGWDATVSDSRLSLVASLADPSWGTAYSAQVFMGRATDLSDIAITAPSSWPKATVLTFAEAMAVSGTAQTSSVTTSDLALPTISAGTALLVATQNNDTITGLPPTVASWTASADAGAVSNYQEWSVYTYIGAAPTPAGVSVSHGGDAASGKWALVIGVEAAL